MVPSYAAAACPEDSVGSRGSHPRRGTCPRAWWEGRRHCSARPLAWLGAGFLPMPTPNSGLPAPVESSLSRAARLLDIFFARSVEICIRHAARQSGRVHLDQFLASTQSVLALHPGQPTQSSCTNSAGSLRQLASLSWASRATPCGRTVPQSRSTRKPAPHHEIARALEIRSHLERRARLNRVLVPQSGFRSASDILYAGRTMTGSPSDNVEEGVSVAVVGGPRRGYRSSPTFGPPQSPSRHRGKIYLRSLYSSRNWRRSSSPK